MEVICLFMTVANTGGILGLCLGFSGLSLIELIYFYTFRAWCRIRRKHSIWTIAALKIHRMWKRAKVRNMKHNQRSDRRIFRANNNQSSMLGDGLGRNDPFIAIPLDFHSKFIFGRGLSSPTSQHMD